MPNSPSRSRYVSPPPPLPIPVTIEEIINDVDVLYNNLRLIYELLNSTPPETIEDKPER
jgi:hypothetical protein